MEAADARREDVCRRMFELLLKRVPVALYMGEIGKTLDIIVKSQYTVIANNYEIVIVKQGAKRVWKIILKIY